MPAPKPPDALIGPAGHNKRLMGLAPVPLGGPMGHSLAGHAWRAA